MMTRLVKYPGERWAMAFEFAGRLPAGTTLMSGVLSAIALLDNTDATVTVLDSTTATIEGTRAIVGFKVWPLPKLYEVTLFATLSNGDILREVVRVGVEDRSYPARLDPFFIRQHVETDLEDEALQQVINAAVADIDELAGPLTELTRDFQHYICPWRIHLIRPAASITEIREGYKVNDLTLVTSTDYSLIPTGYMIQRHDQRWQPYVRVRYIPVQDVARRDGVVIDLVKLALQYQGVTSEGAGDYRATHPDYPKERNKILGRMLAGSRMLV